MALLLTADGSGLQRVGRGLAFAGTAAPPAPTDPYIDNVSLLLHGEGVAGSTNIVDSSAKHAIVANSGSATISTAQKKFGSSSIYFNGSNQSYVLTNADSGLQFGTGDFTVEFFLYVTSTAVSQTLISTEGWNGNYARPNGFGLFLEGGSGTLSFYSQSAFRGYSNQGVAANTWTHIALTRAGNTWTFYINGQAAGSFTYSLTHNDNTLILGRGGNFSYIYPLAGYIDELRITKGIARTISAPTEAYPNAVNSTAYDFDAAKYINAVEAADGQPLEAGVKTAINAFVVGCKADGTWTAIKASCVLAGARTLNGALTRLSGASPVNYNFVSGDYDRIYGLLGNGANKYLDSAFFSYSMPTDSRHLSIYTSTGAATNGAFIGSTTGSYMPSNSILYWNGNNARQFALSSDEALLSGTSSIKGFYGTSRSDSSTLDYRIGGSSYSSAKASVSQANATGIFVFNRSTNSFPTSNRISFYSIGEAVDLALLDARVTTLMADLAAAIP